MVLQSIGMMSGDGVEGAMEIAHEPGPDAYQEHGTYKGLVEELTDELCRAKSAPRHKVDPGWGAAWSCRALA